MMATNSSPIPELTEYLVPPEELSYGEYVYRVHLYLREAKKGFKYEADECLPKIISAMLNSSGGVIQLIPSIPQKSLDGKEFDSWLNTLRGKLHFVPDVVYQHCISVQEDDGKCILVHKSHQFITTNGHMFTRGVNENSEAKSYDSLAQLVNQVQVNPRTSELPVTGPFILNGKCFETESKRLEFKHYKVRTLEHLFQRMQTCRTFEALFGMANLKGGGYLILGIKEDEQSGENLYAGLNIEKAEEDIFKKTLTKCMTETEQGEKRVWGNPGVVPEEGKNWRCEFVQLRGSQERAVLIVIQVFQCEGGMFAQSPEAFLMDDDGNICQVSFHDWYKVHAPRLTRISKKSTDTDSSQRNAVKMSPQKNDFTNQTIERESGLEGVTFADNTTISFSKHSSSWNSHQIPRNAEHTKCPEVSQLFLTDRPVSFKLPSRDIIEYILANKDVLPYIDGQIEGRAFGITMDTLADSLNHHCMKPQNHIMDLVVVNESASITVFVISSGGVADQKYSVVLPRLLKKRIAEAMPPESNYMHCAIAVTCHAIDKDDMSTVQYDFHSRWFKHLPKFKHVCMALHSLLADTDKCFGQILLGDAEIHLSSSQMNTLTRIAGNRFSIVEGPPGCGKTVLARYLCKHLGTEKSAYVTSSKQLNARIKHDGIDTFIATNGETLMQLLEGPLEEHKQHVILDDNHTIVYKEEHLEYICMHFASHAKRLYVFQDTEFQNYQEVPESVSFRDFLNRHDKTYGTVLCHTMNQIQRNSQVVASFLQGQVERLNKLTADELRCMNSVKGDDIHIIHVANLRRQREDNGLLEHLRKLVECTSVDPKLPHYTAKQVAVLVDREDSESTQREVEMFVQLFKRFWPESNVHNADVFPIAGLIVDSLKNFSGLESRVVIIVEPAEMSSPNDHRNIKRLIAKASRGVERVDFLHEKNLDGSTVAAMKCDTVPQDLMKKKTFDDAEIRNPSHADDTIETSGAKADVKCDVVKTGVFEAIGASASDPSITSLSSRNHNKSKGPARFEHQWSTPIDDDDNGYDALDDDVEDVPDHDDVEDVPDHDDVEDVPDHDDVGDVPDHDDVEGVPDHDDVEDVPDHDDVEDVPDHDDVGDVPDDVHDVFDDFQAANWEDILDADDGIAYENYDDYPDFDYGYEDYEGYPDNDYDIYGDYDD